MKLRNGKDFWAGLMFGGFGLAFVLIGQRYPMGSALNMGPGYFPTALGGLLALLGVVSSARGFVSTVEHPFGVFPFRPLLLVAAIAVGGATYLASTALKGAPRLEFGLNALAVLLFLGTFGPRPMFLVLLAVTIFGYALKPLGLVLATVLLIAISAACGDDVRKKEIIALTAVLVAFAALLFVNALGLPFTLWPGEQSWTFP